MYPLQVAGRYSIHYQSGRAVAEIDFEQRDRFCGKGLILLFTNDFKAI